MRRVVTRSIWPSRSTSAICSIPAALPAFQVVSRQPSPSNTMLADEDLRELVVVEVDEQRAEDGAAVAEVEDVSVSQSRPYHMRSSLAGSSLESMRSAYSWTGWR
jgi:hypothetical protein